MPAHSLSRGFAWSVLGLGGALLLAARALRRMLPQAWGTQPARLPAPVPDSAPAAHDGGGEEWEFDPDFVVGEGGEDGMDEQDVLFEPDPGLAVARGGRRARRPGSISAGS